MENNTISIEDILLKTDWKLLKEQKKTLVKMSFYPKHFNLTKKELGHIEGLINWIDTIQDYAVEELGIPEKDVFNLNSEE